MVTSNLMIEREQKSYEMTMMGILINTLATRTVNAIIRSVTIGTAVIIKARRLRAAPLIGFAILLIYHRCYFYHHIIISIFYKKILR